MIWPTGMKWQKGFSKQRFTLKELTVNFLHSQKKVGLKSLPILNATSTFIQFNSNLKARIVYPRL